MDVQNFSLFSRTLSTIGAAAQRSAVNKFFGQKKKDLCYFSWSLGLNVSYLDCQEIRVSHSIKSLFMPYQVHSFKTICDFLTVSAS